MFRALVCLITVIISAYPSCLFAEERLKLVLPDFKPYTYYEQGEFKGIGVEKIKTIFKHLNIPYELTLAPNYGRAVEELKQGRVDGLFLASENEERNAIAQLSQPIMKNRWSWFLHKDSTLLPSDPAFKAEATIATHLNTNTHKWLIKNGYRVTFAPNDLHVLPKTLFNKRIGAVFLAETVFLDSSNTQGIEGNSFEQVIEVTKPFGIYISKKYLASHPTFMQRLNQIVDNKINQH